MDEVSVWIEAPPEKVWTLVTDIGRYGEWSPENRGARCEEDLGVGVKFVGANRHGFMRWSTHCEVVEYEEPSRFAFQVRESRMRWGYRLEPEKGGTKLTEWREQVAQRSLPVRILGGSGLLGRDREKLMVDGMRQTLEGVKAAAEKSGA